MVTLHDAFPCDPMSKLKPDCTDTPGHYKDSKNHPNSPDTDGSDHGPTKDGTIPDKIETKKNSISPSHFDDLDKNGEPSCTH